MPLTGSTPALIIRRRHDMYMYRMTASIESSDDSTPMFICMYVINLIG